MFEEKRQYPFSKQYDEKGVGANTSEQDMQIEVSTAQTPMHQINAIEPTIKRNNSNTNYLSTATSADNNFSNIRDEEEGNVIVWVRNAGDVLYDSVIISFDKAKRKSAEKAKELATDDISPAAFAAKKDAHDIAALGESVEGIARTFESLMTEIGKHPCSGQVNLLTGYKKLLNEQIKLVDSRIRMAERLK
jgi:hypothetical protein